MGGKRQKLRLNTLTKPCSVDQTLNHNKEKNIDILIRTVFNAEKQLSKHLAGVRVRERLGGLLSVEAHDDAVGGELEHCRQRSLALDIATRNPAAARAPM